MIRSLVPSGPALAAIALAATSAACAEDAADEDAVVLPGDIDDELPSADGKEDAWDSRNDPTRLSTRLNYRLAELPRQGKLDQPVWKDRHPVRSDDEAAWSDTYWPTARGSTNTRWLGPEIASPLEKYDAVFHRAPGCRLQPPARCGAGAKAAWDAYLACAGPAARWHTASFQGSRSMYDGVDSDRDGQVDECDDHDGIASWWGLCHAWAPAALLEPEPRHAVTYQGVTFEVADIKALMATVYDSTEALMLGGRCHARTLTRGADGRVADPLCRDVNVGALHVVLTNFLGLGDAALIEDRTAHDEVWNQPITAYQVLRQDPVTIERANLCIGQSGSAAYRPNRQARAFYEVLTRVEYLVEGQASREPLGMSRYLGRDEYHYILELDDRGKIIGGEYCAASKDNHPDFLWAPTRVTASAGGRNAGVDHEKVKILLALSRQDGAPSGGRDTTVENAVPVAIPDNAPAGVGLNVSVRDPLTVRAATVTVAIKHTWRGDLRVELVKDGRVVKVLHDRVGGSADDLRETYPVSAAELAGVSTAGTWTLRVVDAELLDIGIVERFRLTLHEPT
jgi:hypothetical protein